MKANMTSYSNDTLVTLEEDKSFVEDIAVEITKIFSEKNLNYRQAVAVLELVQAEVKECILVY